MTKYTRRSFVKRTGSATLGAALGLGLLPSLTRKLHAADTSTSQGVNGKWKKNDAGDALKVVAPLPQAACLPSQTANATLPGNAGSFTVGIQQSMAPFQVCSNSVTVTEVLWINITAVINGVQRNFAKTWSRGRIFKCEGSAPVPQDVDPTPSIITFPENSTPANALVVVDLVTTPLTATVTVGAHQKTLPWPKPTYIADPSCCPLA